ncbi:MAG: mannose-6-phosphate isomerase, class I [Candidatus Marinimicrobia bacterium CG08_land_8_20_14_0_20_45_22]|nr:MAG: mannose-6-phosphate isomerase, class I [Candidatus Marinimicrobia bacterium CG08_land_8_20_14_0_20_45_22]
MKTFPPLQPQPLRLVNSIQHYSWGMRGESAFIPKLLNIPAELNTAYAELWMGANSSAPSRVLLGTSQIPLTKLIRQYPQEILGPQVVSHFGKQLPFLFKILSAGEVLSIQAHPDKKQAEAIHRIDPKHYPDDTHKPEIAIALDELTALVGFKNTAEILSVLKNYPEISGFIGHEVVSFFQSKSNKPEVRQQFLSTFFQFSIKKRSELSNSIDYLERRLLTLSAQTETESLFLKLRKKYPGSDIGLFGLFFLNLIHLKTGEAIFLPAGVPHAYVYGNIVECMANSDNVVRAGLTPKFQDVPTLINILDYSEKNVSILTDDKNAERFTYSTPADEFAVQRYRLSLNKSIFVQKPQTPEILICIDGKADLLFPINGSIQAMRLKTGDSVLVPAVLERYELKTAERSVIFSASTPQSSF